MLEWFKNMDDETLEKEWRASKDKLDPSSKNNNFICRSCNSWVPGIECKKRKSYKKCEKELSDLNTAYERDAGFLP